ncbi:MAG: radical SAM protein [Rickettsiales bacterium]|jgi:radical SAM protein with 4Fe4S-binding SPASM domain|nr:radical SAM protein [Rickettsiales bacterium]
MSEKSIVEKLKKIISLEKDTEADYCPVNFLRFIHYDHLESGINNIGVPLFLTWNITNECNLSCFFCSASAKASKSPVDNENTLKIADKICDSGCIYVYILGGEPTRNIKLIEVIKNFNKKNIFVEISSNGFGINGNFAKEISKLNQDLLRIKLSLDSSNPKINDKIRGNGSFELVSRALDNLNRFHVSSRIQSVICEFNKYTIYDTYKFAEANNCKSFGFNFVLPVGRGLNARGVALDEDILNQIIHIKDDEKYTKLEKYGFGVSNYNYMKGVFSENNIGLDAQKSDIISKLKCNACKYRLNIDENGDIYPCDMLRFREFLMGNILRDDLMSVFESDVAKKINKISRKTKTKCKGCTEYWCNSGCYGACYAHFKKNNKMAAMCEL